MSTGSEGRGGALPKATALLLAVVGLIAIVTLTAAASVESTRSASPIYGVTLPDGYRRWELIAPAIEAAPLDEIRAVVGNRKAIDAYRSGTLPFPDGSVLVKLAWKKKPSPEFGPATVPGEHTTVQVMVKDARRYASSGGWGFGRFIDGKAVDEAQHRTCFACHQAHVRDHDFVFTRYAP